MLSELATVDEKLATEAEADPVNAVLVLNAAVSPVTVTEVEIVRETEAADEVREPAIADAEAVALRAREDAALVAAAVIRLVEMDWSFVRAYGRLHASSMHAVPPGSWQSNDVC